MALNDFRYSFTPVSPLLRADAEIAADLSVSGGATDAARAAVESLIAKGDNLYNQGQYSDALNEYKHAPASIFKILYPDFDAGSYVRWTAPQLPVSAALENSLLNASARMVDMMRPLNVQAPPVTRRFVANGLPAPLQSFTETGFRETTGPDQKVQMAAA